MIKENKILIVSLIGIAFGVCTLWRALIEGYATQLMELSSIPYGISLIISSFMILITNRFWLRFLVFLLSLNVFSSILILLSFAGVVIPFKKMYELIYPFSSYLFYSSRFVKADVHSIWWDFNFLAVVLPLLMVSLLLWSKPKNNNFR